jgi:hypothetical protein
VGEGAEAVNVGPGAVCVFNSSPLEKYESYRMCLERWHSEDAPDFAPVIYNLIFALARSLGFRTDSPRNGTQPKQLADSLPEVLSADDDNFRDGLSEKDRSAIEEQGCVYDQHSNTFYIRELRMAQAAAECARFLHCACQGLTTTHRATDGLEDTLAYFGARLLCPGSLNEDIAPDKNGAALYEAYLAGEISKAALRRMFLARRQQFQPAENPLP